MALDFPSSPNDGDEYDNFYWDASAGIWRRIIVLQEISDLNNVNAATPSNEDILIYNDSSGNWENGNVSTIVPEPEPPLPVAFLLMGA